MAKKPEKRISLSDISELTGRRADDAATAARIILPVADGESEWNKFARQLVESIVRQLLKIDTLLCSDVRESMERRRDEAEAIAAAASDDKERSDALARVELFSRLLSLRATKRELFRICSSAHEDELRELLAGTRAAALLKGHPNMLASVRAVASQHTQPSNPA